MQEEWFFLDSGHQDAAVNMALDESLLIWHSKGIIPPTLRFYGWSKPTLSVGQFQDVQQTVNFDALRQYNCQFVRRLTGGSAVLHDDELTYSIVVSESHPAIPKTVQAAYYVLSKGLYEGFQNLGIPVEYAKPARRESRDRTSVCFEKAAYYEMMVAGKKLTGNAQIRKKGVLLQHGSIPMSMNTEMLYDLFLFSSDKEKEERRRAFHEKAITINQLMNRSISLALIKDAFYQGFQKGLNITLRSFTLTDKQWQEVYQLAETKYSGEEWKESIQRV